jgi:hypothetical protein
MEKIEYYTSVYPTSISHMDSIDINHRSSNECYLNTNSILFRCGLTDDITHSRTYPYLWFGTFKSAMAYLDKYIIQS